MASRNDIRNLVIAARKRGWNVETTGKGHLRFTHPQGGLVYAPSTPSCYRGLRNLAAELKRQERQWAAA